MSDTTAITTTPKRKFDREDVISCVPILVVLILTNVWFFTQALAYVR